MAKRFPMYLIVDNRCLCVARSERELDEASNDTQVVGMTYRCTWYAGLAAVLRCRGEEAHRSAKAAKSFDELLAESAGDDDGPGDGDGYELDGGQLEGSGAA